MKRLNNTSQKNESGFTITELTLAMSLLSILLFILVISSMGFINIYNKGLTLKRVNQSGSNISQELQANLRRSNENTKRYVGGPLAPTTPVNGVCTGNYSFIWSIYRGGTSPDTAAEALEYDTDSGTQPLYFAKVKDDSKRMCGSAPPNPYLGDENQEFKATELLGDGLVVRDPGTAANQGGLDVILGANGKLTTVILTLSTNGGEPILGDGTNRASCQGNSQEQSFCALNTFVITTYSKGVGLNGV